MPTSAAPLCMIYVFDWLLRMEINQRINRHFCLKSKDDFLLLLVILTLKDDVVIIIHEWYFLRDARILGDISWEPKKAHEYNFLHFATKSKESSHCSFCNKNAYICPHLNWIKKVNIQIQGDIAILPWYPSDNIAHLIMTVTVMVMVMTILPVMMMTDEGTGNYSGQ